MGKPDAVTKEYVSRSDILADIFKSYLYAGREVIEPSHLKERYNLNRFAFWKYIRRNCSKIP